MPKMIIRKSFSYLLTLYIIMITIMISFVLLILPGVGTAADKIVKVATLVDYPPYCFLKENHKNDDAPIPPGSDSSKLKGYSWDMLRSSLHAMGYSIELHVYPWTRAMKYTEEGYVDVLFPTAKTKEREKKLYYSQEYVDQVKYLVYTRKDSTITWSGLMSLNGLTVGVMRGWNYGERWDSLDSLKKYPLSKIIQGFKMLHRNRLDGFAGYEINFDYTLEKNNMKSLFKKHPAFDKCEEFLVGPKNTRILQILKDFDEGKKKIIMNGTFDEIIEKWL